MGLRCFLIVGNIVSTVLFLLQRVNNAFL